MHRGRFRLRHWLRRRVSYAAHPTSTHQDWLLELAMNLHMRPFKSADDSLAVSLEKMKHSLVSHLLILSGLF